MSQGIFLRISKENSIKQSEKKFVLWANRFQPYHLAHLNVLVTLAANGMVPIFLMGSTNNTDTKIEVSKKYGEESYIKDVGMYFNPWENPFDEYQSSKIREIMIEDALDIIKENKIDVPEYIISKLESDSKRLIYNFPDVSDKQEWLTEIQKICDIISQDHEIPKTDIIYFSVKKVSDNEYEKSNSDNIQPTCDYASEIGQRGIKSITAINDNDIFNGFSSSIIRKMSLEDMKDKIGCLIYSKEDENVELIQYSKGKYPPMITQKCYDFILLSYYKAKENIINMSNINISADKLDNMLLFDLLSINRLLKEYERCLTKKDISQASQKLIDFVDNKFVTQICD